MGDVNERIRYLIEHDGQRTVAAGFERIANTIDASGKAADRLSQQLKGNARLAAVEERSAQRAEQARRQEVVTTQLAAAANRQHAAAVTASAASTGRLAAVVASTGGTISQLGSAFGRLTPAAGAFGASLGGSVSSLGALSAGLGPVGIAIAGVSAVIGIGTAIWQQFARDEEAIGKEAADAAKDVKTLTQAIQDQLDVLDKRAKEDQLVSLLSQGLAGTDKQKAELARLQSVRDSKAAAEAALRKEVSGGRVNDESVAKLAEANALRTQRLEIEQRIAQQKKFIAESEASDARDNADQVGQENDDLAEQRRKRAEEEAKAAQEAADKRLDAVRKEAAERERLAKETADRIAALDEQLRQYQVAEIVERIEADKSASEERLRIKREEVEQAIEIENEARHRGYEEAKRLNEQAGAQAKTVADVQRNAIKGIYDQMSASAAGALGAIVTGQKVALVEVLKTLGTQIATTGFGHLFQALFNLASPATAATGVAQLPIATGEIAFGAAIGGIAAAAAPSGGGGGGGSSVPARASGVPQEFASNPVLRSESSGSTSTGASSTTINLTYAPLYHDSANAGAELQRMIDDAKRQGL